MKPMMIWVMLWFVGCCEAAPRIAVLNFELNDITSLPNTAAEQRRTATIRPLLEQALRQFGGYQAVNVEAGAYAQVNAGLGYVFRFPELAARLGQDAGADWVVVGQHSKPSFLFSYLLVHLVNVKSRTLVADFAIELKGNHEKVTQRGVEALTAKIRSIVEATAKPNIEQENAGLRGLFVSD